MYKKLGRTNMDIEQDAWFAEARTLYKLKEYQKALRIINNYISEYSESARAYHQRALILLKLNQTDSALKDMDSAKKLAPSISIDPQFANAYYKKVREANNHQESLEIINKAIKIDPNNSKYYNLKGKILTELKKYKEAIVYYDKALTLEKLPNPILFYNKALALKWSGRYEEALNYIRKSIEIDPNYDSAHRQEEILKSLIKKRKKLHPSRLYSSNLEERINNPKLNYKSQKEIYELQKEIISDFLNFAKEEAEHYKKNLIITEYLSQLVIHTNKNNFKYVHVKNDLSVVVNYRFRDYTISILDFLEGFKKNRRAIDIVLKKIPGTRCIRRKIRQEDARKSKRGMGGITTYDILIAYFVYHLYDFYLGETNICLTDMDFYGMSSILIIGKLLKNSGVKNTRINIYKDFDKYEDLQEKIQKLNMYKKYKP